jgi:protein gp37/ParB-like chromosome segregation protein Spo0J
VKRNGLREPILLNHDKTVLIDGRNRYRACEAAGVDAVFETLPARYTEPMILDLIVSKNLARRQLNAEQRALMALAYEKHYAAAARQDEAARKAAAVGNNSARSGNTPSVSTPQKVGESAKARESVTRAAQVTGANREYVRQAKVVAKEAPDLLEKVRTNEVRLKDAYKQAAQRRAALPKPEPVPKPTPVLLSLRTHDGREVTYPQPASKATFNETKGAGISWAAWSWNPVTGCLHGCNYCYARAIADDDRYRAAYPAGFTPLFHHERLEAPANTVIPAAHRDDPAYRRVFVCSMADLYGRWVPDEWIQRVHAQCVANPQWDYIHLTKFPDRYVGLDFAPTSWVGTSVDEQKRVRIAERAFRQIDGVAVKWLSLEPLKEPLEFSDLSMFDWVVIGAQTETRQPDGVVPAFAPPFDWVARIVVQAREAGCKVHLKPNLFNGRPGMQIPDEYPEIGARRPSADFGQVPGQAAFDV